MQENHMMSESDGYVLKNLSKMGEHLKHLKHKMAEAEEAYNAAKREHDYYAESVLPLELFNAGVSSVELADGGKLSCVHKYYCTPNSNAEDKRLIAEWLRANGGEHLVKESASVDAAQVPLLAGAGIPYTSVENFNTNSLKAFLKDKLGVGASGVAQITLEDIPAQIHFYEKGVAVIDL